MLKTRAYSPHLSIHLSYCLLTFSLQKDWRAGGKLPQLLFPLSRASRQSPAQSTRLVVLERRVAAMLIPEIKRMVATTMNKTKRRGVLIRVFIFFTFQVVVRRLVDLRSVASAVRVGAPLATHGVTRGRGEERN